MDPTRSVALEIVHDGAPSNIELTFEEWHESRIDIVFRDRRYRNSGVIQFDGQSARSVIKTSRAYEGALADPEKFDSYYTSILKTFARSYTFGWSPDPTLMVTYDEAFSEVREYLRHGSLTSIPYASRIITAI